jgi:MFS family permease
MRFLLRLSFLGHLAGTLIMILAGGFWTLFAGALVIAMANGLVEAACNPLVASLYPQNKTVKLNRFHVWFPGGIVIGGLASFGLDYIGIGAWELKLGLILIPTLAYGWLLLTQPFPATEGVRAGVSVGEMFKASFNTPLMWVMLGAMALTASVELGPNRWIPAVLEAGGMPGILVLVWINGLMAVLRFKAGPVVKRISPTGILLASAVVSAVGLFGLSLGGAVLATFGSATVFAVGVCYFWPTMLGVVSERVPRSGALGLGLMGMMGNAVVGLVTAPTMGQIADRYSHEQLPVQETMALLESSAVTLAGVADDDAQAAARSAEDVLAEYENVGSLPQPGTANALRAIIASDASQELVDEAQAVLGPADNYGGLISFRFLVPLCGVLTLIFGTMYMRDRRGGGYVVERIGA